ncbi:MAG: PKD domain-containing protein, partial [Lachnospiraceae bacterium]|nr:PKD domain-containing protein [Lachnospiraceae bacterium]
MKTKQWKKLGAIVLSVLIFIQSVDWSGVFHLASVYGAEPVSEQGEFTDEGDTEETPVATGEGILPEGEGLAYQDGIYKGYLSLSQPSYLEEDLIIEGDLILNQRLQLNQHTLIVKGAVRVYSGELIVDGTMEAEEFLCSSGNITFAKGTLISDGSLYLDYCNTVIEMTNEEDLFRIQGNLYIDNDFRGMLDFTRGTLELTGDYLELPNSSGIFGTKGMEAGEEFRLLLSGSGSQMLDIQSEGTSILNVEMAGEEVRRLYLPKRNTIQNYNSDACEIYEGVYRLTQEVYDFEYKQYTRNGNYYYDMVYLEAGEFCNDKNSISIFGDFYQNGNLKLKNGMTVKGNYGVQSLIKQEAQIKTAPSEGILDMRESSHNGITVYGDFVMNSVKDHTGFLTKGSLVLYGGLYQYGVGVSNFVPEGSFYLDFRGYEDGRNSQISFEDTEQNWLPQMYASATIVELLNEFPIKNLFYGTYKGTVLVTNETLSNLQYCTVQARLVEEIVLQDDLKLSNVSFVAEEGLDINGYNLVCRELIFPDNSNGHLIMEQESGVVQVVNDFYTGSLYPCDSMNQGKLILCGNVTQKNNGTPDNLVTGPELSVIFGGSNRVQEVFFDSEESMLHTVEIWNGTGGHTRFLTEVTVGNLDDVSGTLLLPTEGVVGYTLTEDTVIEGNLWLIGGTLDLNGHTLQVKGDVYGDAGVININKGTLQVEGNLRLQGYSGENETPSFGGSMIQIQMKHPEDTVIIQGDFYEQYEGLNSINISSGTWKLAGSLYAHSGKIFFGEDCQVVLNGTALQELESNQAVLNIGTLSIENSESVRFTGDIVVNKNLYDNGCKKEGILSVSGIGVPASDYTGDLQVKNGVNTALTLRQDIRIQGSLYLNKSVSLGSYTLQADTIEVNQTCSIDRGSMQCNTLYMNSPISMTNEQGSIYVRDFYVNLKQNAVGLKAGTIVIQGSFVENSSAYSFRPTGTHKTVLCLAEDYEGRPVISFGCGSSRFQTLQLDTSLSEYDYSRETKDLAVEIIGNYGDAESPTPPKSLLVSNVTYRTAILSWAAAADNDAILEYRVYREGELLASTTSCTYKCTGLIQGSVYIYWVQAVDVSGNVSESIEAQVETPKDVTPPTTVNSFVCSKDFTASSVPLSWVGATDDGALDHYNLYRNDVLLDAVTGTAYTDRTVEEGVTYTYAIEAVDWAGNVSGKKTCMVTPMDPPSPVTNLKAVSNQGVITVSWKGDDRNVREYSVSIYQNGKFCDAGSVVPDGTNAYSFTTSRYSFAEGSYTCTVEPFSEAGQSGGTRSVVIYSAGDQQPPAITVTGIEENGVVNKDTDIQVEVQDNCTIKSIVIEYAPENSEEWVELHRTNNVLPWTGELYKRVTLRTNDLKGDYIFRITVCDRNENITVKEIPLAINYIDMNTVVITEAEPVEGGIRLAWNCQHPEEAAFYCIEAVQEEGCVELKQVKDTQCTLTGLYPDTTYGLQVVPYNAKGNRGLPSEMIEVRTLPDTKPPASVSLYPVKEYLRQSVTCSVYASDNIGIQSIQLLGSGDGENWELLGETIYDKVATTQKVQYVMDTTELADGIYYMKAVARDFGGNVSETVMGEYRIDNTPPEAPAGLHGELRDSSIQLSWSACETEAIHYYRIYRKVNEDDWKLYLDRMESCGFSDGRIEVDQIYTYRITAVDMAGNESEDSAEVQVSTWGDTEPPSVPQNLLSNGKTGSSIQLTWNASTDNVGVKEYYVYRDGIEIQRVEGTTCYDTGLQTGKYYTYTVRAVDQKGNESELSEAVSVSTAVTTIQDITPKNYDTLGAESVRISFRWNRFLPGGTYQLIGEYSSNGFQWTQIDCQESTSKSSTNQTFMDWSLEDLEDGEYQLRIRVVDPEGNEVSAVQTCYIDKTAPAPVSMLQVTEEKNVVYLYWDKSVSADLYGYHIYRRRSEEEVWTLLAEAEGDVTNYTDADVTEAFRYQYAISAYDIYEHTSEMTESEWIQVSQDRIAPEVVSLLPKNQVLSGRVSLTVGARDNRRVAAIQGEYYDGTTESWKLIGEVQVEDNQAVLPWDTTGLHGRYKIRILAVDEAGNVSEKPYEQYYDIDNRGISKIQNLQGTAFINSVVLSWDEVTEDDFDYFSIEQWNGQGYQEIGRSSSVLGYQVDKLEAETEYSFRVTAYDLCGNRGEESDSLTLTTGADTVAPVVTGIQTRDNQFVYHDRIPLVPGASDNTGLASLGLEYSLDEAEWLPLVEFDCEGRTEWKGSYDWDVSGLPEGVVYIRGIALDRKGNQNAADQYVVEYSIDHTPPEQVTGVRWKEEEGLPVLEWNPTADSDVQSYRVYITDASGAVTQQDCRALFYEHRTGKPNQTYTYQVCAIDRAGNMGELSEAVTGTRGADDVAPRVWSLTPTADKPIRGTVSLSAMVSDNTAVDQVSFYYQEVDSQDGYVQLLDTVTCESGNGTVTCKWDTTACPDGDYQIQIQAVDTAGNKSDWLTAVYQIDNTPPERAVLLGNPGNYRCELDWTNRALGKEAVTYELYRRSGLDEAFRCIYQGTEERYTDMEVSPELEYGYKLRTIDLAGNYTDTYVTYIRPYDIDDIAPNAFITANSVTVEGYELVLDGIQSTDNQGIQSFHWDFGDGTEGSGAKAKHVYTTKGIYTVTLTVTDKSGNTATDTATVKVLQKGTTGSLTITVVDETGKLLSNTCVYAHTSEEENDTFMTDAYGQCTIIAEPGTYKIALFKNGYGAKEMEITLRLFDQGEQTIVLTKGEAVSGELTVRKLNFDEIVAAGIDITAPENQHVYIVETVLTFEEQRRTTVYYINEEGEAIRGGTGADTGSSGGGPAAGSPPDVVVVRKKATAVVDGEEQEVETPTVITLRITQQISWLKDMYEAKLVIYNNAESSSLTFEDNMASIQLPKGISLAKTATPQFLSQSMETIRGGQNQQAIWYLKGDKPGTYKLHASFEGTFMPFSVPVSAEFESNEFTVNAGKGLVLYIQPELRAEYGEEYYVYFTLKNEGSTEFYNVKTTFGTASARRYYRVNTDSNAALPLMSNGDYISIPCLRPGEEIRGYYTHVFQGDAFREDRKAYFLALVDTEVNVLRGENLGVEVEVSPVASHINLPEVLYVEIDPALLAADPVDTWSGAYLEEKEVLSMGDDGSFHLTMQYNSRHTEECGEFGYGWVHNYESRLVDMQDGTVRYYTTPNAYYTFLMDNLAEQEPWTIDEEGYYVLDPSKLQMEQTYTCVAKPELKLERTSEGTYIMKDELETTYSFSAEGNLTGFTNIQGRSISLERTGEQVTITDRVSGRSFTLHLNKKGLVEAVTDSAGRAAHFYYDEENRLTVYENALGERTYYTYDDKNRIRTGAYENGVAYVTNTYDEEGRVLTQDDGLADTPLTFFEYTENEENGHTTTRVTNRLGGSYSTEYDSVGNICRETNEAGQTLIHTYDEKGNEITAKDANGNMKVYGYDADDNLISVTDAYGTVTTMSYNRDGQMVSSANSNGEHITVSYNDKRQVTGTTDQNGNRITYTYNEIGQVLTETDSAGTITYEYTNGDATRTTDRMGNVTTSRYDEAGRMIAAEDSYGVLQTCEYDALGRVIWKSNASGGITYYTYDLYGNVKTITAPDGGVTTYEYDAIGRLKQITDGEGGSLAYTLNSEGWITSVTDSLGNVTSYEYDPVGNVIAEVDAEGGRTAYTYDGGGNVLTTTNPQGAVTTAEYYPNGKTAKIVDTGGTAVIYTYDQNWRISNITADTGESISYEYDAKGNRTVDIDAMGSRTEYTYDKQGNVLTIKDPMGGITAYAYDANGNLIQERNALGNITTYDYDGRNRLTRITRADGSTIGLEYDAGDNVIQTIDPAGNTVSYEYDNQNRCVRIRDGYGEVAEETTYNHTGNAVTVADALGNITYAGYDTEGQIIGMTQTAGEEEQAAAYTYDKLGRLTRSVDSMGSPVDITYDEVGNITGITDAGGGTTTYDYDSMGNLIQETNPIHAVNRYTYNARNLLEEAVNAAGEKTTYTYDELGRITSRTDDIGTIHYTYDKNSNVLTVEENGAVIQRTYDALNRMTSYTDYAGRTIRYSYDEVGNLISLTYPGGEIVRYEYNPDGSLMAVTDGAGNRTEYAYDKNGQLIRMERPDGTAEVYTYDKAGRLTGQMDTAQDGTCIQSLSYTYDGYGNILSVGGMTPDGDSLNITDRTMVYDDANRLIRYNDNFVRYDSKGNMTYGPLNGVMTEFRYDCRNRLIQAGDTTYTYDAENQRIASTTDGVTTEYVIDSRAELSQVLEEYQKNQVVAAYIYGNGTLISDRITAENSFESSETGNENSRNSIGEPRYYHYDNLGSTRAITDKNGEILATYTYGVYGEILSGDTSLTGYLYNGAYGVHTDDNGLYYMRARYYNVDISRFINQDILTGTPTASQSLNRYAYCQGNPVNQNDPFGLCPQKQENQTAHLLLAIAGMVPILGIVANAYNAYLYFEEGDILNGILCTAGAVIGVGGIMSTVGIAAKACTLIQAGQYVKAAGLAYTTAAMAYMTADNLYQTYNLLVENDFTFTEEVQLSIGSTMLAGIGTVAGFKAFINCMNETAAMIQRAEASCFVAGTQVLTRDGFKNIEDIQPGDYVYSTSDETGESDYKEVLEVFVKETEVITHVFYATKDSDGQEPEIHEIETTLNHRFWSEGEWKSAGTLKVGDLLTLADGTQVEVTDVTFEDRHETVYNMEVADYHTYYVGEDCVWVHNRYGQQGIGRKKTRDIYRAVGPEEFDEIMETGEFRGISCRSMLTKEFGNNFDETLTFANSSINSDKAAIIRVTITEDVYNQLDHMYLDTGIFKSGTTIVEP